MTDTSRAHSSEPFDLASLDDGDLLALVHTRSRRFERQIRFRDWRELIAGAIVAVLIAPATIHGGLVPRIGAITILAGIVLVVVRLWRARGATGSAPSDLGLPVAAALRAELKQIDAQIALLNTVGVWYVAPLVGGAVILVLGAPRPSLALKLAYVVAAALMAWGIIALNRHVVRRTLVPKRRDVLALLGDLE